MFLVVRIMQEKGVGCMLVRDTEGHPIGIYSERDLLVDIAKHLYADDLPVHRLMRSPVVAVVTGAPEVDAMLLMIRHNIRHIVLTEGGVAVSVVSERDLFQKYPGSLGKLIAALNGAVAFEDIQQIAFQLRKLAREMVALDLSPLVIARLISEFNDQLVRRILDIEWKAHRLDQESGLSVCWLALGSEARREQPLNTDQDNALIFRLDFAQSESDIRTRLLKFSQNVNNRLDRCGLELCSGGVMAGNSQWCHSLEGWKARIKAWSANVNPESILAATIFFDFRGLWGNLELEQSLRSWLVDHVRAQHQLLHAMGSSALGTPSPIGLFSRFRSGSGRLERGVIDLKSQGSRIFVDAARVESLMLGVGQVSTEARLRQVGAVLNLPTEEVESMVAAFTLILRLRLRLQLQTLPEGHLSASSGKSLTKKFIVDLVRPDQLNKPEQESLREAFKQSRLLQKRLAMSLGI